MQDNEDGNVRGCDGAPGNAGEWIMRKVKA